MNSLYFNLVSLRFLLLILLLASCQPALKVKQPELKVTSVNLIQEQGFNFKDLNKNGILDFYEDWRNSSEVRAADLVSKMSLEEKIGFMIISTIRMENEGGFGGSPSEYPIGDGFNETDIVTEQNFFTRVPMAEPFMSSAGTTKAIQDFHERHFILRSNPDVKTLASWHNLLQSFCEAQPLGIPAIIASNPRNHVVSDAAVGLSLGKTVFSQWPGELGLSATRDLDLIQTFADMARQEWRAVGLRKGYMYMADLSTEPRWQRIEGTFGEDPEWVAQVISAVVKGFQGP
ncbi:MAG: glycoside hydrolase family 3 N-terminal domain-containing protein, partial [Flavobacteriaceae bacterium]